MGHYLTGSLHVKREKFVRIGRRRQAASLATGIGGCSPTECCTEAREHLTAYTNRIKKKQEEKEEIVQGMRVRSASRQEEV